MEGSYLIVDTSAHFLQARVCGVLLWDPRVTLMQDYHHSFVQLTAVSLFSFSQRFFQSRAFWASLPLDVPQILILNLEPNCWGLVPSFTGGFFATYVSSLACSCHLSWFILPCWQQTQYAYYLLHFCIITNHQELKTKGKPFCNRRSKATVIFLRGTLATGSHIVNAR